MRTMQVDVAVIGAGSAGLNARRGALKAGAKSVVMIEGGPYGTTCARVGCMPSKLLIAAADAAWHMQHASMFGVHAEAPRIDGKAVMARVQAERNRFVGMVVKGTESSPEEQRLRGYAHFVGPTTLQVDDHTLVEAKAVVVAAGTTPWMPPVLHDLGDALLTNENVFELDDLPKSLAVVGAGVIGLELGQAFARLGVRVRFFAHNDNIGPNTDPEIRASLKAIFAKELTLSLKSPVEAACVTQSGVCLRWTNSETGLAQEETFEKVLAATGRRPNLVKLGLAEQGLTLRTDRVPVYDDHTMQCEESGVFVAGDFNNDRPLLHEASDEGWIAGFNAAAYALGEPVKNYARRTPLAVVFTQPQLAMAGQSYADLTAAGTDFAIGSLDFARQGRARVMGMGQGRLNVYGCTKTGRLLGTEMVGPASEHLVHQIAWMIQGGLTATQALQLPFYHPVLEEGLRTALRDLAQKMDLLGPEIPELS